MMILCIICLIKWEFNKTYEKENHIHTYTCNRCDRCFFIGRNTVEQPKQETHKQGRTC